MNEDQNPAFTDADLEASLTSLGATELEQRLEFAPLLAGPGDAGPLDTDLSVCCSCKIPDDFFTGDGVAPAILGDPNPGGGFWGTGPVNGGGF